MSGRPRAYIVITRGNGEVIRLPVDRLGEWLGTLDDQLFILSATAFEAQALGRTGGDARAALAWMEEAADRLLTHDDGTPIKAVPAADGQRHAIEMMRRLVDAQDEQDQHDEHDERVN